MAGSRHVFAVSEQHVSEDLLFLGMLTPEHSRVSGMQGTQPSGPEATRAMFLGGMGLDPEAATYPPGADRRAAGREPHHPAEFGRRRGAMMICAHGTGKIPGKHKESIRSPSSMRSRKRLSSGHTSFHLRLTPSVLAPREAWRLLQDASPCRKGRATHP